MANPFDQFDAPASGNPFDQFDQHQTAPVVDTGLLHQAKMTGRAIASAAGSMPLAAMDAGVATRNILGDYVRAKLGLPATPDYQLPSQMYNGLLDQTFGKPANTTENAVQVVGSALAGARLPVPVAGDSAPAGFVTPKVAAAQTAAGDAINAGYVIPPSTTNPTVMNRILEGISGKIKLQQEARQINQGVTNAKAAQAVGLNTDAPITQGALSSVRSDAYNFGYRPLKDAGPIGFDDPFRSAIDDAARSVMGPQRDFPGFIGDPGAAANIGALLRPKSTMDPLTLTQAPPTLSSAGATTTIQALRDKADEAFRGGSAATGRAYKQAATAVEDLLDRNLSNGENGQSLLSNYRTARQTIAKTHTVGDALIDDMGTVSAPRIGSEHAKNPNLLNGPLLDIGRFARNFPTVARPMTESNPSISPLDVYGAGISAGVTHSVAPFAIPLTRVGLRNYLLSSAGQARAIPGASPPPDSAGLAGSAFVLSDQIRDYLLR